MPGQAEPEPAVQARRADPDPATAERLLALLPDWFGIPEATAHYVESAATLPTYLAFAAEDDAAEDDAADGEPVGITLILRHFPATAEIYLAAVHPDWHRRGAGRAMLAAAEADLAADGVRFLQVKTLGESRPHDGYARTRAFYLAAGFTPLEELTDLWPGNPCLLLVKALPGG